MDNPIISMRDITYLIKIIPNYKTRVKVLIKSIIFFYYYFFFFFKSHHLFLRQILWHFLFLQFLSNPLCKSAFRSLQWGFLTLMWNLVPDFLILKWYFPHNFRAIFPQFSLSWNWFPAFEIEKKNFFKLRKALFKRGLERNCKKKSLSIWRRKRWRNYFLEKKKLFKKDYPFNFENIIGKQLY